jgi:hypothetical protein
MPEVHVFFSWEISHEFSRIFTNYWLFSSAVVTLNDMFNSSENRLAQRRKDAKGKYFHSWWLAMPVSFSKKISPQRPRRPQRLRTQREENLGVLSPAILRPS